MEKIVTTPRLLCFDIECSTITSRHFRVGEQYMCPDNIVHDNFIISIAWQWYGTPAVLSVVTTPEEALARDDSRIVRLFAEEARKADYFIYHNGDRFDNRLLNSKLLKHDIEPIGETKSFDTLKLSRKYFGEHSNKLDDLAQKHLGDKKHDTDMQLWIDCEAGKPEALMKMVAYNKHDVRMTTKWFDKIKPFIHIRHKIAHKTPIDKDKLESELAKHECNACGTVGSVRVYKKYKTAAGNLKFYVRCQSCRSYQALKGTFKEAL